MLVIFVESGVKLSVLNSSLGPAAFNRCSTVQIFKLGLWWKWDHWSVFHSGKFIHLWDLTDRQSRHILLEGLRRAALPRLESWSLMFFIAVLQRLEFIWDLVRVLFDPAHRCVGGTYATVNRTVDRKISAIVATSTILQESTHVGLACFCRRCIRYCFKFLGRIHSLFFLLCRRVLL